MDLFGNNDSNSNQKIRTLGFYQPFSSLMLPPYDKIETRWVRKGKKPPFPLGKYLFYTTLKPCDNPTLIEWSGADVVDNIIHMFRDEPTKSLYGYAIGIADLVEIKLLAPEDEPMAFVKFVGEKEDILFKEKDVLKRLEISKVFKVQWGMHFTNRQRIEPFKWEFGKQGVGFVPESELCKIKIIS